MDLLNSTFSLDLYPRTLTRITTLLIVLVEFKIALVQSHFKVLDLDSALSECETCCCTRDERLGHCSWAMTSFFD